MASTDWDSMLDGIDTEDDWPSEFKAFKEIEKSLRCCICHQLMNGAVLLSTCGHSFCSLCIREFLYTEKYCPVCRVPTTESSIVKNIMLTDVAYVYSSNRKALLEKAKQMEMKPAKPTCSISSSEKEMKNNPYNLRKSKKRVSEEYQSGSEESKTKMDSDNEEYEIQSIMDDSDNEFEDEIISNKNKRDSSYQECPICGGFYHYSTIESHASMCDGTTQSRHAKAFNGFMSTKETNRQPLPILCYNLLQTSDLKKQLQKYSIPVSGSRDVLIQRHRQFTLRYNAELDKRDPMPVWKIAQSVISNEEKTKKLKKV